ncbi:MAG: hypothetical protein ACHQNV_08580 [Vicinamibacteria bacterium]
MRAPARATALLLVLPLFSAACVEDRLVVDVNTVIHGDGSCTRHVVYQLERTGSDAADPAFDLRPDQDPLRVAHRFPAGEAWTVQHEVKARTHAVTLDANLPSPNAIDWDYWRAATPRAPAARNHFSFAMEEDSRYEYSETFLDPASPLQAMRLLAQLLGKSDGSFADELLRRIEAKALRRGDVTRAFREAFSGPFLKEVSAIGSRPVFGPRERKEIEALLDRLSALQKDLAVRLLELNPSLDPATLDQALDDSSGPLGDELQRQLADAGLPSFGPGQPSSPVHFHVTLVMPAPIVRANTCAQGDTATWDFDGEDLYGRGFEMWAVAASR